MSDLQEETAFFERHTEREVTEACRAVIPMHDYEVIPCMFDATVIVRHAQGDEPTREQIEEISRRLRGGREIDPDSIDWRPTEPRPYRDALDHDLIYGTSFGLVKDRCPMKSKNDQELAGAVDQRPIEATSMKARAGADDGVVRRDGEVMPRSTAEMMSRSP